MSAIGAPIWSGSKSHGIVERTKGGKCNMRISLAPIKADILSMLGDVLADVFRLLDEMWMRD